MSPTTWVQFRLVHICSARKDQITHCGFRTHNLNGARGVLRQALGNRAQRGLTTATGEFKSEYCQACEWIPTVAILSQGTSWTDALEAVRAQKPQVAAVTCQVNCGMQVSLSQRFRSMKIRWSPFFFAQTYLFWKDGRPPPCEQRTT